MSVRWIKPRYRDQFVVPPLGGAKPPERGTTNLSYRKNEMKPLSDPNLPKVSVVIPAYNHERYVKEAVCSVLEQTVTDIEVIIINDGSTDKTHEAIQCIADERIQYFHQENRGAAHTLNRGIRLAKGHYVSILNSDDRYEHHRFEECLKILETDPSRHAAFSHVEFIDDQGNHIRHQRGATENWADHHPEPSFKGEGDILLDLLAGNFLVSTSNLFCRRSVFDRIGRFSDLKYAHDYDFFLRLCHHFKVALIDMPLLKYRLHPGNTIRENEAETDFEVGLLLSDFFVNHDMRKFFPDEDRHTLMAKFFNSIHPCNSERMIMTLLLFGLTHNTREAFSDSLTKEPDNPFRKACIGHFRNHLDMWQESQRAWKKWAETNDRLIEADEKLAKADEETRQSWQESQRAWEKWRETNDRLMETEKHLVQAKKQADRWQSDSAVTWRKHTEMSHELAETRREMSQAREEAEKFRRSSADAWETCHQAEERLAEAERRIRANESAPENRQMKIGRQQTTGNGQFDISVVVPAHEEGILAHPTMESIFRAMQYAAADRVKSEVIVVLDRPDPSTEAYFSRYEDAEVKRWVVDFGDPGLSRNYGVQRASGKYVAFLDADDLFGKHWLRAACRRMKEDDKGCVCHPEYVICFEGEHLLVRYQSSDDEAVCLGNLIEHNHWTSFFVTQRSLLMENPFMPTPQNSGFGYEDWHWLCEAIAKGIPVQVVPETCVFYRRKLHGSRLSRHNTDNVATRPSRFFEPEIFSSMMGYKSF